MISVQVPSGPWSVIVGLAPCWGSEAIRLGACYAADMR